MLEVELGDGRALRQLEDGDAEALFDLIDVNRAHLANWMPFVSQTHTVSDSLAFIRAARRQAEENRGVQLAIIREDSIIGVTGFHGIDWGRGTTSIGYWLGASHQGAGTMTVAVTAMLDHAFEHWRLARVEIRAGTDNLRSRAIPERLGFTEEGVLRAAERIGTRVIDHAVYVMTAREWLSRSRECSRS